MNRWRGKGFSVTLTCLLIATMKDKDVAYPVAKSLVMSHVAKHPIFVPVARIHEAGSALSGLSFRPPNA
jgi:hypothetical protein